MISVLMSVYNEKIEYVHKAVESILAQTYKNIEVIIVLDNPDSAEHIDYLKGMQERDCRIKLLVNQVNIGLAMSLNRALADANGEYIARMDADDISYPDRLEKELLFLEKNDLDIVSCYANKIDEHDVIWGEIKSSVTTPDAIKELLAYQNVIIHPTILMRNSVIMDVGGYRNFASCQDYDLWLRLADNGYKFGIMEEILFSFRRHKESITATRRFNQILNEQYIRKMHQERLVNGGKDSYTTENLEKYLVQHKYYDKKNCGFQNQMLMKYGQGTKMIKDHLYIRGIIAIMSSLRSAAVRVNIITTLKANLLKRKFRKVPK